MATTWLVAHDFSPLAHAALASASETLSKDGGGRLVVAHVHQPTTGSDGAGIDLALLGEADLEAACIKDAERRLGDEVATTRAANVEFETRVVIGRPAAAICELASALHAKVVVVGSHGRHGLERFFLGSVAEAIVRDAPCAVLVIKTLGEA